MFCAATFTPALPSTDLLQRRLGGRDDLAGGTLALEPAVGVDESADTKACQALGFLLEVPQSCRFGRRHDQNVAIVPRGWEFAVAIEHAFTVQPSSDLFFPGFQVAQGVFGIEGIDLKAKAVLGLKLKFLRFPPPVLLKS